MIEMKAVSVQRKKVTNAQIDRKLEEIMLLLKQVIKADEMGSGICEHCGKPVNEHRFKPGYVKKMKKWLDDYKSGKINGKVYKDFAEFAKATS
ncbi:MAG: hypothetical protein KGH54_04040 [Candidatus Micrarchaeota archaeon]|nr:hypothetical protein [Candidatus Micrarchaeota archaeon]